MYIIIIKTVADEIDIDPLPEKTYVMQMAVIDSGGEQSVSTLTLHIVDLNDHAPIFSSKVDILLNDTLISLHVGLEVMVMDIAFSLSSYISTCFYI